MDLGVSARMGRERERREMGETWQPGGHGHRGHEQEPDGGVGLGPVLLMLPRGEGTWKAARDSECLGNG